MSGDQRIWGKEVNGLGLAGDTMTELMHLIADVTLADQGINTTRINGLSWAGDTMTEVRSKDSQGGGRRSID